MLYKISLPWLPRVVSKLISTSKTPDTITCHNLTSIWRVLQLGTRSRKKIRDRYAAQKEERLRAWAISQLIPSFQMLRQNAAVASMRQRRKAEDAKLVVEWRRILNFRRRVILRWRTLLKENEHHQTHARRAILYWIQALLGGALRSWRMFAADQRRQQYILGQP